jgi:hypothetical protein
MVGGGAYGKAAGIGHIIITAGGLTMTVFQVFILMWIPAGDDTIENIAGTDIRGTMNAYPISNFNGTGRVGEVIDIGKGKKLGASRTTNPSRNSRGRN